MEGLGRLFNVRPSADGGWINMQDCQAVTFIGYLTGAAGETYTLQQATSAGGAGAVNLATIDKWYTSTGDGTDTWTAHTQAAAATVVAAALAAENAVAIHVAGVELSDGFKYIKVTSTGAGTVCAIAHGLTVQRKPANLRPLST